MLTLYYTPGTCSMAVHAVLNELNAEFTMEPIDIRDKANQPEAFKRINPRGNVPVLVDDGFVVREGAAILEYLAEKYASDLLPASGQPRSSALQWLMFANATLHPAYGKVFFLKAVAPDGDAKTALLAASRDAIQKLWDEVEMVLTKTRYVAGDTLSLADFLLPVIANWVDPLPKPIEFGPKTREYLAQMRRRPSFSKMLADEGVDYKAAA